MRDKQAHPQLGSGHPYVVSNVLTLAGSTVTLLVYGNGAEAPQIRQFRFLRLHLSHCVRAAIG